MLVPVEPQPHQVPSPSHQLVMGSRSNLLLPSLISPTVATSAGGAAPTTPQPTVAASPLAFPRLPCFRISNPRFQLFMRSAHRVDLREYYRDMARSNKSAGPASGRISAGAVPGRLTEAAKVTKRISRSKPRGRRGGAVNPATPPTRFLPNRRCAPRSPRFTYFFQLPAELRTYVYQHLLLVSDEAIDVNAIWNPRPSVCRNLLGLVLTSRHIGNEAAHFFYTSNTFCLLEHCDDFNAPDADNLQRSEALRWLSRIGPVNAAALRNVQLRVRLERPPAYYRRLVREMTASADGIARLAVVGERHASTRALIQQGHLLSRWEPNQVNPLTLNALLDIYSGWAGRLSDLQTVVLAGQYDAAELSRVCAVVGCRLHVVDGPLAVRDQDRSVLLWKQKTIYEGFPTEDGGVYSAGELARSLRENDCKNGQEDSDADNSSSDTDSGEGEVVHVGIAAADWTALDGDSGAVI